MKTGGKPTPLEIRQKLDDSHRALVERAVKAVPKPNLISADNCPSWLEGEAAEVWMTLASELEGLNMLTVLDIHLVGRYCDLFVKWKNTRAFLKEKGNKYPVFEIVEVKEWREDRGEYIRSQRKLLKKWLTYPEVGEYDRLCNQLIKLEQELGMTPVARTRIGLTIANSKNNDGKVVDPFDYN